MLRRQLTAALAASALLAACGGADGSSGGAIRENVVEPGITAIDEADQFACDTDRRMLEVAIEAYAVFTGDPPPDEAALVDADFIRARSELWDVVDGDIVVQGPACADAASVTTIGS